MQKEATIQAVLLFFIFCMDPQATSAPLQATPNSNGKLLYIIMSLFIGAALGGASGYLYGEGAGMQQVLQMQTQTTASSPTPTSATSASSANTTANPLQNVKVNPFE
jgi:hypothetical protein